MAPESGLFQASLSASVLRSAALAIALLVQAAPARAQVVTLVCANERHPGSSFTLRVDYDQKTAALLNPDGTASFSASARITEGDVSWNVVVDNMNGYKFQGGLNRLSGGGWVGFPQKFPNNMMESHLWSGPCRRATQKF